MGGFNDLRSEFEALGVDIYAASVDPLDKAREIGDPLYVPMAYGVTRAQADALGAWWEERRQIIQPSEFLLDRAGTVVVSSYSDGPLGRIDAADVVRLVKMYEARKAQQSQG